MVGRRGSFEYFAGAEQDRLGNCNAQSFGGLEIDHQLEVGRLLDRQLGRLGSFENLINVGCCPFEEIRQVRPVGAPGFDRIATR